MGVSIRRGAAAVHHVVAVGAGVCALLVVGVIVWAVVYASRRSSTPPPAAGAWPAAQTPPGPSARVILDQRYARGEIETAEYVERRSKLG